MAYQHNFQRHKTREVRVGDKVVGGDNPIVVQSMTTPDTNQVEAVIAEIHRLEDAGCELVRVTVPKPQDAAVLGEIRRRIRIPLICDIHFDYKMALAALDHPVDKIRINPGNIGGYDRYRQVIRKAKAKGLPMRIGVNAGSLERELVEKHGFPCPPAMVESALRYLEIAESEGYHDIIVSLKSSDVLTACPTCGRLEIDLEGIIAQLEKRLAGRTTAVKVSVLGCVVNGPGEAREADLGIAAGKGK